MNLSYNMIHMETAHLNSDVSSQGLIHQVPATIPMSETEWLSTGKFIIDFPEINGRRIKIARTKGDSGKTPVVMVGGIPRDLYRRENMPVVNGLYGLMAMDLLSRGISSLAYNHPSMGGSEGDWNAETFRSRAETLAGVSKYLCRVVGSEDVAIMGTSAGAYMAAEAIEPLSMEGIKIAKIILLSPACYPREAEEIPYGENFSRVIRARWNFNESPIFSRLEKYAGSGGSLMINFFEFDDPPIPLAIQECFKTFATRMASEERSVFFNLISGVAHNFRKAGSTESDNIIDEESVKKFAGFFSDFLSR